MLTFQYIIIVSNEDLMKCEVCHENYDIVLREVLVFDNEHALSCTSFGHFIFGTVLIFCLVISFYLLDVTDGCIDLFYL